jgi:hypothetical protein
MGPVRIQDIQNVVNNAQNRIIQQLPLKQDLVFVVNSIKNLMVLAQQNQQFLRQAEIQRIQLVRRMAALEARIASMEQDVKWSRSEVSKIANRAPQPQTIVLSPDQNDDSDRQQQYVYRTA